MGAKYYFILTILFLFKLDYVNLVDPIDLDEFYNEADGTYSIPLN